VLRVVVMVVDFGGKRGGVAVMITIGAGQRACRSFPSFNTWIESALIL